MNKERHIESEGKTLLEQAALLQDGLILHATDGEFPGGDESYKLLRREMLQQRHAHNLVPLFVRQNRNLAQFWQFIKSEYAHYAERRQYIWEAFNPLLERLEQTRSAPGDDAISLGLARVDADAVHNVWHKALERRGHDPEGAITAARSLLETVCKHLLDDIGVKYSDKADMPKLWNLCAEHLNLAPSQHAEEVFKAILGNCQSIVNNLSAIRNKVGDAHGQGRRPIKPQPRHAELAVNLAGTMAAFLVTTWEERKGRRQKREQS